MLLAPCEGNPSVIGGFPSQRPVTQSFDIFFDLRLNKRLNKQSGRRWFETHRDHHDVIVIISYDLNIWPRIVVGCCIWNFVCNSDLCWFPCCKSGWVVQTRQWNYTQYPLYDVHICPCGQTMPSLCYLVSTVRANASKRNVNLSKCTDWPMKLDSIPRSKISLSLSGQTMVRLCCLVLITRVLHQNKKRVVIMRNQFSSLVAPKVVVRQPQVVVRHLRCHQCRQSRYHDNCRSSVRLKSNAIRCEKINWKA